MSHYGPMVPALAADLVVLLHAAFVVFVVAGGLLVLWRRGIAWLHLPAAAWGVFVELTGRICPLTPLENRLRAAAGLQGYEGDFVERYIIPVLYPDGLRRDVQVALGLAALAINVAIYWYVWRRSRAA